MHTLELTEQEIQSLAGLLDAGVKALGLRAVKDAASLLEKLDAAHRAQGILTIWQPDVTPTPPQVDTSTIIAVVGIKGTEALEQIGLTNLPMEEMG